MVAQRSHNNDFDDAEKGLHDNTADLPVVVPPAYQVGRGVPIRVNTLMSTASPIHEGLTPFSSNSQLELSLTWPKGWQPPKGWQQAKVTPAPDPNVLKTAPPKPKISRWVLFQLWFNTYRKFFTFVTLLNLTGIILAALDRFPYAENHLGALVLGNLLCAILMRNELFLRILYMIAIYGLRSVRFLFFTSSAFSIMKEKGRETNPSFSS